MESDKDIVPFSFTGNNLINKNEKVEGTQKSHGKSNERTHCTIQKHVLDNVELNVLLYQSAIE